MKLNKNFKKFRTYSFTNLYIKSMMLINEMPKKRPHIPPIETEIYKSLLYHELSTLISVLIKSKFDLATVRLCRCFGRSIKEIVITLPDSSRYALKSFQFSN